MWIGELSCQYLEDNEHNIAALSLVPLTLKKKERTSKQIEEKA